MPSDRLVAKLWEHHREILYKFCDHQSLLKNQTEEELNDEEIKVAWEEFRKEEEDYKSNIFLYLKNDLINVVFIFQHCKPWT